MTQEITLANQMPKTQEQELMLLKNYPTKYWESLSVNNLEDVFSSPKTSMALFRKESDTTQTKAVISIFIIKLVKNINVGKTINAEQIAELAGLILDEYYFLTFSDFKLLYKNILLGRYGKAYDRLDAPVILEWIAKYVDERFNYAENSSYQKHFSTKEKDEARNGSVQKINEI